MLLGKEPKNVSFPPKQPNVVPHRTTMSAFLLVMDDTIKLTEWLAYHYTVLPLSHLIVAIDPGSTLTQEIQDVLHLYQSRLYIEIWTNDTWMTLKPNEGWPPGAYDNGTLVQKRIQRVKSMTHKRRQEHFAVQCMRRLKQVYSSWILCLDTDEFLIYNYLHDNEDASVFLHDGETYRNETIRARNQTRFIRTFLPTLGNVTIVDFLNRHAHHFQQPCIKVPGLPMSAREYPQMSRVYQNVPRGIDAKTLTTLRHAQHGRKEGNFTKCLLDVRRIPLGWIRQDFTRTIHNPLALNKVCGKHGDSFIGMDYISSILRLHHYAGTRESFEQRQHDVRVGRNVSYEKRNVEPVGETEDIRPWIQAFVKKVGMNEAQRLLQPLQEAYRETNWSAVWENE
jgi:hypothetical protein